MARQIPTNLFTLPQHLRTIVMFHLVDFAALDKFIDKVAKEQAVPSLKNQDQLYLTAFLYDLAMIKEWDTLRYGCLEKIETCSNVFSDLTSKLDSHERMDWDDDSLYVIGEWFKALNWRKEEYSRVRKVQPAKKSTAQFALREVAQDGFSMDENCR